MIRIVCPDCGKELNNETFVKKEVLRKTTNESPKIGSPTYDHFQ